MTEFKVKYVIG